MKNIAIAFIIGAFSLLSNASQAQNFNLNDNVVQVTVGFGNTVYSGSGYTNSPVFGISGERCFFDDLINGDFSVGIGGAFGYSSSKYEVNYFGGKYGWKYTTLIIAGRGTFHWNGVENLDLYAGVHVGAKIVSAKETGDHDFLGASSAQDGGVYFAPFAGARYYFNDSFFAVGEVGSGLGVLNIGAGIKF